MEGWDKQWRRVQRSFERFTETTTGRVHDRDSDYYQDEVYAFFQNAYHLKEWLKNDRAIEANCSDVEAYTSGSPCLTLCADLCNGSKHLTLTSPRGHADTQIGQRQFSLELVPGV